MVATPLIDRMAAPHRPPCNLSIFRSRPPCKPRPRRSSIPRRLGRETVRLTAALLAGAPTVADLARISLGSGEFLFIRIAADTAAVLHELGLKTPLLFPHSAPQPILVREELLDVFALDPGVWGNRLRVSARREPTPLVRSRIRSDPSGIQDPQHIRLDSAAGVEPGTILSLADATGAPVDTPFKVDAIDRQNGYLLTLNTALPGRPLWARQSRRWSLPLGSTCSANRIPGSRSRTRRSSTARSFATCRWTRDTAGTCTA